MAAIKLPLEPYFTAEGLAQLKQELSKLNTEIAASDKEAAQYSSTGSNLGKVIDTVGQLKRLFEDQYTSKEDKKKEQAAVTYMAAEGFKKGAEGLINITKQSFEVLESVYKELKRASPLMQAVEQIFQLAWTLFFMPLGNKLGELLIPAVIEILDKVVSLWDEIGEGGLGEVFSHAISEGVKMLGQFFKDIGTSLQEQGGFLGKIGELLNGIGNFIENNLVDVVMGILTIATSIVSHIGTIVTLITTFMGLHYALQLATMATIAAGSSIAGWFGAGAAVAAVGGAAAGLMLSGTMGLPMAEGGYVPPRPGGTHVLAGEAGEGEYIVPNSKVGSFVDDMIVSGKVKDTYLDGVKGRNTQSNNSTYNITINGYTDSQLKGIIEDVVSEQISRSRLRSGF